MAALVADPVVRRALNAVSKGDGTALLALFTPGALLTDDGSAENVGVWVAREIVEAGGRLTVESVSEDGRSVIGRFRSHLYELRTEWRFEIAGDRIARLDVRAL